MKVQQRRYNGDNGCYGEAVAAATWCTGEGYYSLLGY